MSDIRDAVSEFRDRHEPFRPVFTGWLIDHEEIGTAKVSEEPGYLYVMVDRGEGVSSGDVVKAFGRIRPVPGWPVRVSTTRDRPWEYTILDVDLELIGGGAVPGGSGIDGLPILEHHHETHEWSHPSGSDDVVYPRFMQLYDFGNWPGLGVTVNNMGGIYNPSGTKAELDYTNVSLAGLLPPEGERWILICISPTGTFELVPGVYDSFVNLDDIPVAPSPYHWEVAAVKVQWDSTSIVHTPTAPSIVDLRFARLGWPTGDAIAENITRTVGTDKHHATIQEAIDWFKGRLITGACKIEVDEGSYDEALVFEDIFIAAAGALELEGDIRELAGLSYVDGADGNQAGLTDGGDGVVTLSNSGTDITVACASTNPDFDADGWGTGDTILVYDNAGAVTEETIDSVANNVITLTGAAPAVGNDGTAICLMPNRRIERTTAGPCITVNQVRGVQINGWYLESATGANCNGIFVQNGGGALFENCLVNVEDFGFYGTARYSWLGSTGGAVSAWGGNRGIFANNTAQITASYGVAVGCTDGFIARAQCYVSATGCIAVNCTQGFKAEFEGFMYASLATARQNTTGYYAQYGGYIYGTSIDANNNGNGTDYNPAPVPPGSAQGNHYAVIYAT